MGRLLLQLLLVSAALSLSSAASLEDVARDVSRRILVRLSQRETMSLQVRSLLPAPGSDTALVQRLLIQNLRPRMAPPSSEAPVAVRVTLNRNPQTHLLITEIRRGEEMTVLLDPYQPASQEPAPKAALAIEKKLVWQQQPRILDLAIAEGKMLILDSNGLSFTVGKSAPIAHEQPWPRDLRGRLIVNPDGHFEAQLPGQVCRGSLADLKPECTAPSPLVAGRNYFTHPKLNLHYAKAPLESFFVVAGLDGRSRLVDAGLETLAVLPNLGSEVAALEQSCAGMPLVIASHPSNNTVTAYRLNQRTVTPVTDPLDLGGAITVLWPSEQPSAVTAIVQNLETSQYAAYRLSLTCSR